MKKAEFYVLCKNNENIISVQTRKGYIDTELNIGYSHFGSMDMNNGTWHDYDLKYWNATDLVSGLIMASGKTKKECIENATKNIKLVNEMAMSQERYQTLVDTFKRLKAEKGVF